MHIPFELWRCSHYNIEYGYGGCVEHNIRQMLPYALLENMNSFDEIVDHILG